jgi:hypothetical protein
VDETPSPELMRKRRRVALRVLGVLLLLGVVGLVAWSQWSSQHLKGRLARAVEELDRDDPNWRLEQIEATRPDVPESKNSARVIMAARKLLPHTGWPPVSFDEPLRKALPNEQLDPKVAARLNAELDGLRPAVREARRLKDMPHGRHRLTIIIANPHATLLPDQQEARAIASLLRYDVLRRARAQDMKGALESCRGVLNAGRSLDDEPIAISQLVRIACVSIACGCVERVLAQGEPEEADLKAMQALLELEDQHPTMLIACRGERAFAHAAFEGIERGTINAGDLGGGDRNLRQRFFFWRAGRRAFREHPHMLEVLTERVEAARLPLHEQGEADRRFTEAMRSLREDAVLTRLLLPALQKISEATRRKAAQVRCAAVVLAAERYRRAHKRWPATLAELTPKYLAAVPLDPFDGKPLRYRRAADGVIVYSVGHDGIDNGGVLDRENLNRPGVDLGYQLWDVAKRRQPPRPAPPPPPAGGPGGAPGAPGK